MAKTMPVHTGFDLAMMFAQESAFLLLNLQDDPVFRKKADAEKGKANVPQGVLSLTYLQELTERDLVSIGESGH